MRFFLIIAAMILAYQPVQADEGATAWHNADTWQARLLWRQEADGAYQMAVHLRLDAGWKTYWRHAGESGLATDLQITGGGAAVIKAPVFPRPDIFPAADDLYSIGYKEELVLPWLMPVVGPFRLTMDFGVCEDLCLPARFDMEFDPATAKANRKISRYLDQALSSPPRHKGTYTGNVVRDGGQILLPGSAHQQAVMVVEDNALVARKRGDTLVFALPHGDWPGGQAARVWFLDKGLYDRYDITLPAEGHAP